MFNELSDFFERINAIDSFQQLGCKIFDAGNQLQIKCNDRTVELGNNLGNEA